MSCQQWKDGLCVGGDCNRCKHNPANQRTTEQEVKEQNTIVALALIIGPIIAAVCMCLVLA